MSLLAAVAAPAPLVPIVMLTTALGWLVATGFLWVYRNTISEILTRFADWFGDFGISIRGFGAHPFGPVASKIRAADHAVIVAFETWIRGAEITLHALMGGVADTFEWMGREIADLADTTAGAISTLARQGIPDAERRAIDAAKRGSAAVARDLAHFTTVALPGLYADVGALGGRIRTWEHDLARLGSRVRHNERLLTGSAFAALTMIALRKMGLAKLRCGNVRKNLTRLCGLNPLVLDAFFLGALALSGPISVERYAKELLAVEVGLAETLLRGITELRVIPANVRADMLADIERGVRAPWGT